MHFLRRIKNKIKKQGEAVTVGRLQDTPVHDRQTHTWLMRWGTEGASHPSRSWEGSYRELGKLRYRNLAVCIDFLWKTLGGMHPFINVFQSFRRLDLWEALTIFTSL